jgi:hypothetical protein
MVQQAAAEPYAVTAIPAVLIQHINGNISNVYIICALEVSSSEIAEIVFSIIYPLIGIPCKIIRTVVIIQVPQIASHVMTTKGSTSSKSDMNFSSVMKLSAPNTELAIDTRIPIIVWVIEDYCSAILGLGVNT